jgi:aspartate aminotransferase
MVQKLSSRIVSFPASPMRKLAPLAAEAKKKGVKVYHLNIGDPDIKTPDVMIDVLRTWETNPIGYDQSQGNPAFLSSLASYYQGLGFPFVTPETIQVTTGGSEAISMALFAVANPGDEVIVFEPFYANYNSYALANGVTLVPVTTSIENGFHLPERSEIEKKITGKTKAILICNPNNPTGTVYTKDEMDMLIALVKENGLYLLSDEVYREYTYDGRKQVSLLSYMEALPEQTIVLDSLSKRYSLCGARLGCIVTLNKDILSGCLKIAQGRLSSGFVDQQIGAALTKVPASYIADVQKEYTKRRDILYEGLRSIPGVIVSKPEGAFYVIAGLPVEDAGGFAKFLLTDFQDKGETVMVAPAAGFYATPGRGANEIRIAYILNTTDLTRCLALLTIALSKYNQAK